MNMIIYGAGLAGLLAANMLRRFKPVIYEAQPSLPNNHEALLRFRTDAVSRATGIPFKQVEVTKAIVYKGRFLSHPDLLTSNLYSYKVTGEYHSRSISDLRPALRYIAPPNLIEQMARSCHIEYNSTSLKSALESGEMEKEDHPPVISTVPMPILMGMLNWPNKPSFSFRTIWSAVAEITRPRVDLYQTIYYPSPEFPCYRASLTGNRLIMEFICHPCEHLERYVRQILEDFGIAPGFTIVSDIKEQKYGKLLPIDDAQRRRFILAMTDDYRIYSVGRFATWRQILMDDVVADVARVESWVEDRDGYNYARRLS